jgi:HAD superfamily hydrolase (TIGR01509 family)
MTNPTILRRLLGDDADSAELARLSAAKEECYRATARGRIALMEGVRELLDRLTSRGVRLAIGSSSVRANLELTVSECRLDGRFAAIVGVEDVAIGKPDPQVFLEAAARSRVDVARAVVFEDAPVGILAARAAGMRAVGVGTTHSESALRAAGADEVVASLAAYDVEMLVHRLANGRDRTG